MAVAVCVCVLCGGCGGAAGPPSPPWLDVGHLPGCPPESKPEPCAKAMSLVMHPAHARSFYAWAFPGVNWVVGLH